MDGYTSDHYSFLQVTADEVRDLGFLQHVYGNGIDTIFALEQYSDLTFKLPLLINSSFETYYDSSDGGFGIYNVEQVIKTCDAFGNITFFGNTDQALRITSSTAHRVYQDGNLINFWYQREYEWLTKSIGFFDIDVDTSSILSGNVPIQEIDVTVFSGATGINNQNGPINTFTLEQNYPNPFNPSTVISYQLPVSGFVSLKVYDVLGNEVATLVNGEQNSGSHSINFNAAQLSSGVYIYRLNAGKFSETKSMILIR
ncbi:MAG: T9SS C-terminal target domain-containing protein [Ignavibacteriales bacterium]|nr:MAG: T9SS C-terminal target domain-containing protein [Ignavibacteriales bacterium]